VAGIESQEAGQPALQLSPFLDFVYLFTPYMHAQITHYALSSISALADPASEGNGSTRAHPIEGSEDKAERSHPSAPPCKGGEIGAY